MLVVLVLVCCRRACTRRRRVFVCTGWLMCTPARKCVASQYIASQRTAPRRIVGVQQELRIGSRHAGGVRAQPVLWRHATLRATELRRQPVKQRREYAFVHVHARTYVQRRVRDHSVVM